MSKFYGQVFGQAETIATRRGHRNIRVSAQSWNGSVITTLNYNDDGDLMVEIETSDGSDSRGYTRFRGTMKEFIEKLTA